MQTFILPRQLPRDRLLETVGRFLAGLSAEKAWKLEVGEHKQRRTDNQNRYLWGVCYPAFCKALGGFDAEDVHDYLLGECFGWETVEVMGRRKMRPIKRSSKLDKHAFAEYVDFVIRKGAEHGVHVPEPTQ